MQNQTAQKLSPRKLQVLAAIVEAYVASGEPIGSKLLAEQLGVSSATIRNEMAALADIGYLEQPHTSAGRIPSQRGYRVYVDRLMQARPLSTDQQLQLERMLLLDAYDSEQILQNASKVLAGISRSVALSTTPSGSAAFVRGVQFVQTGRRTAMAILMLSSGAMKHRVFRCDFDLTPDMTRIFFRVLNERLAGKALQQITPAFVQSLAASLGSDLAVFMASPLMAILELSQDAMEAEIRLHGQTNLLCYREFDATQVRHILDFLESRHSLEQFLFHEESRETRHCPVQILIGRETNRPELQESSVLLARYQVAGKPSGMIGLIGPTRMDYCRLVAQLSYLAETVGRLLTGFMLED